MGQYMPDLLDIVTWITLQQCNQFVANFHFGKKKEINKRIHFCATQISNNNIN